MAKEMYAAMVMKMKMEGVKEGGYPDVVFVAADSAEDAVKQITSYKPDHPRWQATSRIAIIRVYPLEEWMRKNTVQVDPPVRHIRRRRRRV